MILQVVLRSVILVTSFFLLVPCRDYFALALWRMERLYGALGYISGQIIVLAVLENLTTAVLALVATGMVLAVAILAWHRTHRVRT